MKRTIFRQFSRPKGWLGWLVGVIMATRPSNRARNRWTIDLLAIAPSDRVLEIGYGPGLGVGLAAAAATAGLVAGLDHSCVMHGQAVKRNRAAVAAGRVVLRTGGLDDLSVLGGGFDKAFCVNVAQFWPDRAAALTAIRVTMRPGGRLAVTYQPRGDGASAEAAAHFADHLAHELEAAGFTVERTETLALKPAPAVCVLARA